MNFYNSLFFLEGINISRQARKKLNTTIYPTIITRKIPKGTMGLLKTK